MKLGIVTYNIARDWDIDTIITNCQEVGLEAVELRTTHAHGVEPDLDAAARASVRERFETSGVRLLSLGSTCEFHSPDAAEVQRNIDECERFARLAADVGADAVKVRPNALPEGVPVEKTLAQIGEALVECGRRAAEVGIQVWVEVHGRGTNNPVHMETIMNACTLDNVGVTWNSNDSDVIDGSIQENFDRLKDRIRCCHITELWSDYPWREEFQLLHGIGYEGYTLAEIPANDDPVRLLKYYRALWIALQP